MKCMLNNIILIDTIDRSELVYFITLFILKTLNYCYEILRKSLFKKKNSNGMYS